MLSKGYRRDNRVGVTGSKHRMALVTFLDNIRADGFTEELERCLLAQTEQRFKKLCAMLGDVRHKNRSWSALCDHCGVTLQDLNVAWQDFQRARGLIRMATQLPDIMGDVARDARSTRQPCEMCEGLGTLGPKLRKKCFACEGTGWVTKPGCSKSRELVFETMKLTGKREPLVNLNVGGEFSLESLVGQAASAVSPVVETTVEHEALPAPDSEEVEL